MAPSWLHGGISREKAEALVGLTDGTFLVRKRAKKGGGTVDGEYVLTVVFKGKPTHHAIKPDESGLLCVNGKPHGSKTTIEELVGYLDQKRKGWPVALDNPVNASGPSGGGSATSSSPTGGGAGAWLHGGIPREEAEALVGSTDGTFLVRKRAKKGGGTVDGEYVLTVVFKGKPTHHAVKPDESGVLCVNGKPFGNTSSLEKVVAFLGERRKGWPVGLDKPVYADGSDGASGSAEPPAAAAVAVSGGGGGDGGADDSEDADRAAPEVEEARAAAEREAEAKAEEEARAQAEAEAEAKANAEAESEAAAAAAAEAEEREAAARAEASSGAAAEAAAPAEPEPETESKTPPAHRRKLRSLGVAKVFMPPSPETERKAGVPWGQGDLKKTDSAVAAAGEQSAAPAEGSAAAAAEETAERSTAQPSWRQPAVPSVSASSPGIASVPWNRNVPQHKVRVYEVLRALFSESKQDNPKKLLLSRDDLATRFTLKEITPVLQDIGAFDPDTGAWKLQDVFKEADPGHDGSVSLANFLRACDPDQAAQARAKADAERRRIEESREQAIADEAAREAARIEAERRATERALVEAKKAEIRRQQEMQEKMYREHQARLEEIQRIERQRIQQELDAIRAHEEAERKRRREEKIRRQRERREAWKARQLPMPWEVKAVPGASRVDAMV